MAGSGEQLLAFETLALAGPTTYSRSRTASKARQRWRKSPSQARSRATVDIILEATARILSRRGYAGTNTNRIAEIAGVSVGSIYQYFPNKEALVAALRDRHSRDMHILFQRVVGRNAAGSLLDGLAALVGALMQAHREDVALHMILESKLAVREQKTERATTDRAILRLLRAWLNRHRREITVPSLDLAAHFMFESIVALVHSAIREPSAFRPRAIEAEILALVMGYLTAPRPLRAEPRRPRRAPPTPVAGSRPRPARRSSPASAGDRPGP